jgi:hypothetical protein
MMIYEYMREIGGEEAEVYGKPTGSKVYPCNCVFVTA